jgi:hypothetical protein
MLVRVSLIALTTVFVISCGGEEPEQSANIPRTESQASAAEPAQAQSSSAWQVRIDRSRSAEDPDNTTNVDFTAMGPSGFHYAGGPAGTLWMPGQTVSGNYVLSGTFTLNKPASHTTYYGLVFGGSNMAGASQHYLYFQVAQDGTYLVKVRDGDSTNELEGGKTKSPAVQMPGSGRSSVNTLEVRVAGDTVEFVVNGTVVHTSPRTGTLAMTDGIVGARVNHVTDVTLTNFRAG